MPESQCTQTRCWWQERQAVVLQTHFDRIRGNLAEIQPKNHQNVQKTHFLQKAPWVNGLNCDCNCDDSLRKQPSFFAPGPSGATRAGSEEERLFSSVFPQFKLTSFHVSFLARIKMKSINLSAPKIWWVFIAPLVEHCSANAWAMGWNPVKALKIFSG